MAQIRWSQPLLEGIQSSLELVHTLVHTMSSFSGGFERKSSTSSHVQLCDQVPCRWSKWHSCGMILWHVTTKIFGTRPELAWSDICQVWIPNIQISTNYSVFEWAIIKQTTSHTRDWVSSSSTLHINWHPVCYQLCIIILIRTAVARLSIDFLNLIYKILGKYPRPGATVNCMIITSNLYF